MKIHLKKIKTQDNHWLPDSAENLEIIISCVRGAGEACEDKYIGYIMLYEKVDAEPIYSIFDAVGRTVDDVWDKCKDFVRRNYEERYENGSPVLPDYFLNDEAKKDSSMS